MMQVHTTLYSAAWEAMLDVLGKYLEENPDASNAAEVRDAYDAFSFSEIVEVVHEQED